MSSINERAKKLPNVRLQKDAAWPLLPLVWAGLTAATRWAAMRAAPAALNWGARTAAPWVARQFTQKAVPWAARQGARLLPSTGRVAARTAAQTARRAATRTAGRAAVQTGRAAAGEAAKKGLGGKLWDFGKDMMKWQIGTELFNAGANALGFGEHAPTEAATGEAEAGARRPAPARPPVRTRAPRLNVHFASFNHGRRIAFDAGIEELCKRAQLDREDRDAMFRMLEKGAKDEVDPSSLESVLRQTSPQTNADDFGHEKKPANPALDLKIKEQALADATRKSRWGPVSSSEFQTALDSVSVGDYGVGGFKGTGNVGAILDTFKTGQPTRLRMYDAGRDRAREKMLEQGFTADDIHESERQWVGDYIPTHVEERGPNFIAEINSWQPTKQQQEKSTGPKLGPPESGPERILADEAKTLEREKAIQEAGKYDPNRGIRQSKKFELEDVQADYMKHLLLPLPKDPGDRADYDRQKQDFERRIKGLEKELGPQPDLSGEGGPEALRAATELARTTAIERGMANVTLKGMTPWEAATAAAGNERTFRGAILKAMEKRLPAEHGMMIDSANPDRPPQEIEGWQNPDKAKTPAEKAEINTRNQATIGKVRGAPGPVGATGQTAPQATATPAYTPASPSGAVPGSAQQAAKSINQAGAVAQRAIKGQDPKLPSWWNPKGVAPAPTGRGQIITNPEDMPSPDPNDETFKNVDLIGESMGGADEPTVSTMSRRRTVAAPVSANPPKPAGEADMAEFLNRPYEGRDIRQSAEQARIARLKAAPPKPAGEADMAEFNNRPYEGRDIRQSAGQAQQVMGLIPPSNPEPENLAASESVRPGTAAADRLRMDEMAQEARQQAAVPPPPKSVGAGQGQYDAARMARDKALLTPPAQAQPPAQQPQAVGAGAGKAVSATAGTTQQPGAAGNNLLTPGAKIPPPPAPDLGKGSSKAKA